MTARIVIYSQAAIWFVVALMLLAYPVAPITLFGASYTPFTVTLANIFGAELMGLALVSWFTRETTNAVLRRHLLLAYFICNSLGFLASLWGRLSGALVSAGWILVALYLLYAVAFAYLRFTPAGRDGDSLSQ